MWAGVTLGLALIKFSPSLVNQILKNKNTLIKKQKFKKSLNKKCGKNFVFINKCDDKIFLLEPLK